MSDIYPVLFSGPASDIRSRAIEASESRAKRENIAVLGGAGNGSFAISGNNYAWGDPQNIALASAAQDVLARQFIRYKDDQASPAFYQALDSTMKNFCGRGGGYFMVFDPQSGVERLLVTLPMDLTEAFRQTALSRPSFMDDLHSSLRPPMHITEKMVDSGEVKIDCNGAVYYRNDSKIGGFDPRIFKQEDELGATTKLYSLAGEHVGYVYRPYTSTFTVLDLSGEPVLFTEYRWVGAGYIDESERIFFDTIGRLAGTWKIISFDEESQLYKEDPLLIDSMAMKYYGPGGDGQGQMSGLVLFDAEGRPAAFDGPEVVPLTDASGRITAEIEIKTGSFPKEIFGEVQMWTKPYMPGCLNRTVK